MVFESGHLTRLLSNLEKVDRIKLHDKIADDEVKIGSTATKTVGFHGKTPIVQATVAATTTTTSTTGALTVDIDAIRTALINKGIIN